MALMMELQVITHDFPEKCLVIYITMGKDFEIWDMGGLDGQLDFKVYPVRVKVVFYFRLQSLDWTFTEQQALKAFSPVFV